MDIYILEYSRERDRLADRLKQKDLSRRLLSLALKNRGIDIRRLTVSKSSGGKPYFENCSLKFNLSHTPGMVAVAVSEAEVGVDCQIIKPITPRHIERLCSPEEKAVIKSDADFALIWAKKEALLKLKGQGLTTPIRDIDTSLVPFSLKTDGHAVAAVSETTEEIHLHRLTEDNIQGI